MIPKEVETEQEAPKPLMPPPSPNFDEDPKKSDPNGIRTRVTPVKGECPRPLDDRVVSGVKENALSGLYFKLSSAFLSVTAYF